MSGTPDPQLVRELAREAVRCAARRRDDIDAVISSHAAMAEILASGDRKAYGVLYTAVRNEMKTSDTVVTWPDEVLPWPVVVAAGADAGVSEEDIRKWLDAWAEASGQLPDWPPSNDMDRQASNDRDFAWHELRLFSGMSLLDEGDVDQYEVGHPPECATLPPGAMCWAVREPFRWWWPTARGTYRIRPEDVLLGGDEDGPDWDVTLHVQVRDEAGNWTDYDGDTAGAEPTSGEYDAIVERIKTATAEKMARQADEQNARDDDVTSVRDALIALDVLRIDLPAPVARRMAKLHARFADRIAELDARTSDGAP